MSYTPTTWQTGDTITAAALNKMEQGIAGAGGVFIVGFSFDLESGKTTCDKTAQQIAQAIMGGSAVVLAQIVAEDNQCSLRQILYFEYDNYDPEDFYASMLTINGSGTVITWTIDSADSYPFTQSAI